MKSLYIIITQTGTALSNIIKLLKKTEYNHVSIALEPSLEKMYSFGRLNPYNPFIGGFVEEGIHHGTFKRFKNTTCKVFSLKVSDIQYENLKKNIFKIEKYKNEYSFNVQGLINAEFNIYKKYKNKFYCSEFVKFILQKSNINIGKFPKVPQPQNFAEIPNSDLLYTGLLQNYSDFFNKNNNMVR